MSRRARRSGLAEPAEESLTVTDGVDPGADPLPATDGIDPGEAPLPATDGIDPGEEPLPATDGIDPGEETFAGPNAIGSGEPALSDPEAMVADATPSAADADVATELDDAEDPDPLAREGEPAGTDEAAAADDKIEGSGTIGADDETEGSGVVGEEPLGFDLPPPMSVMHFIDVVLTLPSTHPVMILQEAELPYRELRIPIGGPEGIAIGYASRQMATPRPLTHELMTNMLEQFNLTLEVVRITRVTGGMFSAELTISGPSGIRTLDCRPSDAIALALRQRVPVPILAASEVLDSAGGSAAGAN